MAKKKATKKAKQPEMDLFAVHYHQMMENITVYERARYGSVAPTDRQLPAAHAASALRLAYEGKDKAVPWGEIFLSIYVAAMRDGNDLALIDLAMFGAMEEWRARGDESAPGLKDSVPGTHSSLGVVE